MLFGVERKRIEVAQDAPTRYAYSHKFTQNVGNNAQENDGNKNNLWLEMEDLLQYRAKDGQPDA